MFQPETVAVLGAGGQMGQQLMALFADVGCKVLAFDTTTTLVKRGIQEALLRKPSAFLDAKKKSLIIPCNYDFNLHEIGGVGLVIEAVTEKMEVKKSVFERISGYLNLDVVVVTNTSGLSIAELALTLPQSIRSRFFALHFFNPVRLMRLLEAVPHAGTDSAVLEDVINFCEDVLGKTVVTAKDTPGFIANRIGVHAMMLGLHLMQKHGLTIEQVDAITGPVLGRPKTASLSLLDFTGVDILYHVAQHLYSSCPSDEDRDTFKIPGFLQRMIDEGMLGRKAGKGFYQKTDAGLLVLDLKTFEYREQQPVSFDSLNAAKRLHHLVDRIEVFFEIDDPASRFIKDLIFGTFIYAANRIPEISNSIVSVDQAMELGFGWEMGPFRLWYELGAKAITMMMLWENRGVPRWVLEMTGDGKSFYGKDDGKRTFFDMGNKAMLLIQEGAKAVNLALIREQDTTVIARNDYASLVHIGDDVACLQFHNRNNPAMNPINGWIIEMLGQIVDIVPAKGLRGLVIGNQAPNFCAGADLALFIELIKDNDWGSLEALTAGFQTANQALRFAPFPVVVAPYGFTLGGGCEVMLAAHRIVAGAELYAGLVEPRVGIIPGGGGTVLLFANILDAMKDSGTSWAAAVKAFETILHGKTSNSAHHARLLGFLRPDDPIVMNPNYLLYEAKQAILTMAENFVARQPREFTLSGKAGQDAFARIIDGMQNTGKPESRITAHDAVIAGRLAYVLTGGAIATPTQPVSERQLLDLELVAIMSLFAEPLTLARMEHMLKTGKPLRN